MPGFLTHDIGLKITAFLLALFLWFNVAERKPVEIVTEVPLKYTNMPAGMTFASEVPTVAKARVRGRGRFVHWKLKDVHFAINLAPAVKGIVTHVVSPSEAVMPSDKGVEVVEVIDPKAIRVELDMIVAKEIPVIPRLQGTLASDRILLGAPAAQPARIMISGAQRVLGDLKAVSTAPIDMNHLARKGRVTARIDLSGLPPLSSDVEEVIVTARIEPRRDLGIPAVPIEPMPGRGPKARFTPETVDVVISGAASQVDSLDPREIRLLVDVAGLTSGQVVLTPVVSEGALSFEARPALGSRKNDNVLEIEARVEAPYKLEVVSITPDEIGLVLR